MTLLIEIDQALATMPSRENHRRCHVQGSSFAG